MEDDCNIWLSLDLKHVITIQIYNLMLLVTHEKLSINLLRSTGAYLLITYYAYQEV